MPSKLLFNEKNFGEIEPLIIANNWLKDSLILNEAEMLSLIEITKSNKGKLLYRATRDGFTAKVFHSKCDGKANTITIIKNNFNYVFGGYASTAWKSLDSYVSDDNAFVFSLRRNGESKTEKFTVKSNTHALQMDPFYGPVFGGCDIVVENNSDVVVDRLTNFGSYYHLPEGYPNFFENTKCYLIGKKGYLTVEIEIYQIN